MFGRDPRKLFGFFFDNELELDFLLEAPSRFLVGLIVKNDFVGFFIDDLDDEGTNDFLSKEGLRIVDLLGRFNNDDVGGTIVIFFDPCLVKAEDDVPPADIFFSLLLLGGEGASIVLN